MKAIEVKIKSARSNDLYYVMYRSSFKIFKVNFNYWKLLWIFCPNENTGVIYTPLLFFSYEEAFNFANKLIKNPELIKQHYEEQRRLRKEYIEMILREENKNS